MLQPLTKGHRLVLLFTFTILAAPLLGQASSPNLQSISIQDDEDYSGLDLLETVDQQVFVMAEHWHNIRSVPAATLKLLKYLHQHANVRILAIEQGKSAAYLVNKYLDSGDSVVLRQIVRNTMFWGKENYAFFQNLYRFNQTLPKAERVMVRSIDIEYKMESAIFVINELIADKEVPESLTHTVGVFQQMFEDTRAHREQYDALAVMYYYDREFVTQLVEYTLVDIGNNTSHYEDFFGTSYDQFATVIKDMSDGLFFDYTNPNTNYKFRDQLIYEKFLDLLRENPKTGMLTVFGLRHATKPSSIHRLSTESQSPIYGKVTNIRVTALHLKMFKSADLRRINFAFPKVLKTNNATLIKHDPDDPRLKSTKPFEYTLFINDNGSLTPFENRLKEDY